MTNFEPRVGDRVHWMDDDPDIYVVSRLSPFIGQYTGSPSVMVTLPGHVGSWQAMVANLKPTAQTRLAHRRRR